MKTVYIIWGHEGEYDDYHEWNVAAYKQRSEAEKHLVALLAWLNQHHGNEVEVTNPYDTNWTIWMSPGPHYSISEMFVQNKFVPVA